MNPRSNVQRQRLKYAATINDEALGDGTDADYELQYVDIGNVDSAGKIHEIATYRFEDAPSRARRRVRDGDVIISCVRTYLQAISPIRQPPDNLIVSTGFAVVRPRDGALDAAFAKYALREPAFLAEVEMRSVGVSYPAINASDLADIPVCLPPRSRQRTIADYLDRETARLDALVAAKERVLGLLAEKRRAFIARAVTRGLDPRAPLRDSAIPWLGEIPAHWTTLMLRYACAAIHTGGTPSAEHLDDTGTSGVNWFTPGDFQDNLELGQSVRKVAKAAIDAGEARLFPAGTVFVVGIGATLGKTGFISQPASANQQINALVPASHTDSRFLVYLLTLLGDVMNISANSATLPILNQQRMGQITVTRPPLEEQRAIVRWIEKRVSRIDVVRRATESTIVLLRERRAALIAAAVTGQVEVAGG